MKEKYKVLFICKKRVDSYGISFGLLNSAKMLEKALASKGIEAKAITVFDANGIDKEVYEYKPTHVVIHALWVVPQKMNELCQKYPAISWNIRIHSKPPFLAMEGIASDWIREYRDIQDLRPNLWLSANSEETHNLMEKCFRAKSWMLPNVYVKPDRPEVLDETWDCVANKSNLKWRDRTLNVACFGAVRPLKNHYQQAAAAMLFADKNNVNMRFHINGERQEQGGSQVLKNLRGLFEARKLTHKLVEHRWYSHSDLVWNILPKMDVGMQVSLSETFNIVAADMVCAGIPIIGSSDIDWLSSMFIANSNSLDDIVSMLGRALSLGKMGVYANYRSLEKNNRYAIKLWEKGLVKMAVNK